MNRPWFWILSLLVTVSVGSQTVLGVRFADRASSASVRGKDLPDLYEASIAELQAGLEKGNFNSVDLINVR